MEQDIVTYMKEFSLEFIYVILAAAAGIARYLQKYLEDDDFGWKQLIAQTIVSAFSGYMFGEFGQWLGLGDRALFLMVGMGGYMGAEGLKFIEITIKRYITKK